MAGLGFDLDDFALLEIENPDERADALDRTIQPKLMSLASEVVDGLGRIAGRDLFAYPGKVARKKNVPPEEAFVAFAESEKGYRALPYLAVIVTRENVHARVAARNEADKTGAMQRALIREAPNLARKGKPFRRLRSYNNWAFEGLPELAPAHSAAFWEELAEELGKKNGVIDVGIAWTAEEARSMALGDLLGAFRDLAPLFKLLANAG